MFTEGAVALKPLAQEDAIALASLADNKKVWDNLRDYFPFPYRLADARTFIASTQEQDPQTSFGIFYRQEVCGVISLIPQQDVYRKNAEIGYWIGEPFWHLGIATVAVKGITSYGFRQLGLKRIQAGIFECNPASMRVLEKNGYKKEGVFPEAVFKNGTFLDEHRYAIINPFLKEIS